jgi:hypothetical protein
MSLSLESCVNVSNFIDENMNTKDKVETSSTPPQVKFVNYSFFNFKIARFILHFKYKVLVVTGKETNC